MHNHAVWPHWYLIMISVYKFKRWHFRITSSYTIEAFSMCPPPFADWLQFSLTSRRINLIGKYEFVCLNSWFCVRRKIKLFHKHYINYVRWMNIILSKKQCGICGRILSSYKWFLANLTLFPFSFPSSRQLVCSQFSTIPEEIGSWWKHCYKSMLLLWYSKA